MPLSFLFALFFKDIYLKNSSSPYIPQHAERSLIFQISFSTYLLSKLFPGAGALAEFLTMRPR